MAGGTPAAVLRAGRRARIGTGVSGPGAALWVQAELVDDEPVTDARAHPRRRVQVAGDRHPAEARRVAGHRHGGEDDGPIRAGRRRRLGAVPDRGAEARDPRDTGSGRASRAAHRLDAVAPRRDGRRREDPGRRARRHGEDAARVPAAPAARGHPQGAGRGRAGWCGRLPHPRRGGAAAGQGPGGGDARGRPAGARQRPEPGVGLDPHVARHRARDPVADLDRGQHRHHRRARGSRRRSSRAGRREGPHRRVPGRPQPASLPRPAGRRRPRVRRRAGARRPARRRQDLARRERRAGTRPEVRPGRARRRPRRGGDPRPPANLRRRAAGPHRPRHHRGRLDEPGHAARRGRQGGCRLPGRPRGGAAGGARSRRRTTPSATTTSTSTSTCPTCCSWRPPTCSRPSRPRCWTGWS